MRPTSQATSVRAPTRLVKGQTVRTLRRLILATAFTSMGLVPLAVPAQAAVETLNVSIKFTPETVSAGKHATALGFAGYAFCNRNAYVVMNFEVVQRNVVAKGRHGTACSPEGIAWSTTGISVTGKGSFKPGSNVTINYSIPSVSCGYLQECVANPDATSQTFLLNRYRPS